MAVDPYKIPGMEYLAVVPDPERPDTEIHHLSGGRPPEVCDDCGGTRWHVHTVRRARFRDMPVHRKKVEVLVDRKRMKCASCGTTKSFILDEFDTRRYMTKRLLNDIRAHCLIKPHAEYERETGVPTSTVSDITKEQLQKLDESRKVRPPRYLGVDEFFVLGRANGIFTDVANKTIYDCVEGRRVEHFAPILSRIQFEQKLELIVSDMYGPYRSIFAKHARGVPVVIDRFHVVRMANNAVEVVRRKIQKHFSPSLKRKLKRQRKALLLDRCELAPDSIEVLEFWLSQSEYLKKTHEAKERFGVIYDFKDRLDAEKALSEWENSIDPLVRPEFESMISAIGSFREEITNFFDFEYTNGFTESVNRLVKDMNRLGRGYSWDVLRGRILHYEFIRDIERKVYTKADLEKIVEDYYLSIRGSDGGDGTLQRYYGGWEPTLPLGPKVDEVAEWIRRSADYQSDLDDDYDVNITYPFYRVDEPDGQLSLRLGE